MGGITLLALVTIKNTALEVVTKRDVVLAEFAAKRLAENLHAYPLFLQNAAEGMGMEDEDLVRLDSIVAEGNNWLHFFDEGLVLYDIGGDVRWASHPHGRFGKREFPNEKGLEAIRNTLRPFYTDIIYPDNSDDGAIVIAVPVIDGQNHFQGVLAGVCSVRYSTIGATYSRILEYESGKSSFAFLVDGNGTVLYHRHSSLIGTRIDDRETVGLVMKGRAGAMVVDTIGGKKVISGYAPVPGTGWGVVTQGNWSLIKDLIQFYNTFFQIVLWGGAMVGAILVFYFMQRILGPVRELTKGAAEIAHGNFIQIPIRKTHDEIEVLSRQFNSMARAMKASFAATEERIEELDKARKELSRSEERIRGIINAVTDIMFMVDDEGTILWMNDRGNQVFGNQSEGSRYSELFYQQTEIPDDCFIKDYFTGGVENDVELKIWSEEKYQDYWCTANVVQRDRSGKVLKVVVVCRNITEKKQLRSEVQRNAQLAALGELAAGIAHEINNPITGIINFAQIIDDSWEKEGSQHEQLPGWIIKEGERIAIIVSKLLSFARRDVEKKQPVLIGQVIEDMLDLTGKMLTTEQIEVELDIPVDLPPARAVIHQFQQIILNIISNARYALNKKYEGRDPQKKIVITASECIVDEVEMVRVSFKDYGTGIAKSIIEKVCNPFFSTKPPEEGTGLGLSISYGIIEEHEGELMVESVEGEWTKITIDLPIWQ